MPRKLPGPLVDDLIAVADLLAGAGATPTARQASMRRAVSSAYYAVFHALCAVCCDELVGRRRTETLAPIYRSLDHGVVLRKLRSQEARRIDVRIERIGVLFAGLQEQRHAADYAPPSALFSRTQTLALIDAARDAIALIEALEAGQRLELAILLIARVRVA